MYTAFRTVNLTRIPTIFRTKAQQIITCKISGSIYSFSLVGSNTILKLSVIGNIGYIVQYQIMKTYKLSVLGGCDIGLNEISSLRNGSLQ